MYPRWNWDSPTPLFHQRANVPLPPEPKDGGTLAFWWGVGGGPIPTTGAKDAYSLILTHGKTSLLSPNLAPMLPALWPPFGLPLPLLLGIGRPQDPPIGVPPPLIYRDTVGLGKKDLLYSTRTIPFCR
jgi:hypothetical protein